MLPMPAETNSTGTICGTPKVHRMPGTVITTGISLTYRAGGGYPIRHGPARTHSPVNPAASLTPPTPDLCDPWLRQYPCRFIPKDLWASGLIGHCECPCVWWNMGRADGKNTMGQLGINEWLMVATGSMGRMACLPL